jgi:hypothetical protein
MEIEPICFSSFLSFTSGTHALCNTENVGCGWYATIDRRVAGRIYFNPTTEQFCATVLHVVRAGWNVKELKVGFNTFNEAEIAIVQAMTEYRGKPVTLREVPARLRFGKGRVGQKAGG